MARIRTIKPEFWESESIGSLTMPARLLFICCWNIADDYGLLRWNATYLNSQAFMYDQLENSVVENYMNELVSAELVNPYEAGKKVKSTYAIIKNWKEHQLINRPGKAKYPNPEHINVYMNNSVNDSVNNSMNNVMNDSREEGKGIGKEGSGIGNSENNFLDEFNDVLRSVTEELLTNDQKEKRYKSVALELKNSTAWHESVAIALNMKPEEIKLLLPEFLKILKADGEYFKPLKQIQAHFRNWAKRNSNSKPKQREYFQNQNIPLS